LSNGYVGDVIILTHVFKYKKSLQIPKGQSEPVNRRRTYNTIAKRKKDKMTNNDLQNIHIKLKMDLHEPLQKPGDELMCSGMVSSSCSTTETRRVNLVTKFMISHE
jgi:hypothetical protein